MLLGDLLNSLAKMAGIDEKDDNLVKLNAIKEISTAEVADELGSKIQSSLMTMDAALNNPEIVNKLKAESLNAVDDKLGALAKDVFNTDDAFVETLKGTKGTYNRMDLFAKHIAEAHATAIRVLEDAKGGTDDKGAKAELQKKIDELNGELSGIKESTVTAESHKEMITDYEGKILDLHKKNLFSNYDYALDVSKDVNIITASSLFNSELLKRGVKLINKEGVLTLETEEGTKYFVDNKEVAPKDLADAVLAEHKLLKVNGTPPPAPAGTPLPAPQGIPQNGADMSAVAIATQHVETIKTLGEAIPA